MRIESRSVRRGNLPPPFVQTAFHGGGVKLAALRRGDQAHREREPVHTFERRDERAQLLGLAERLASLLLPADRRLGGELLFQREGGVELLLQRRARLLGECLVCLRAL